MTETQALPVESEKRRLLTVSQVAIMLQMSRSSVYNLVHRTENPLPSVKVGKSRRFPIDLVMAWMEKLHNA